MEVSWTLAVLAILRARGGRYSHPRTRNGAAWQAIWAVSEELGLDREDQAHEGL
jgi:hypothetical protein